MVKLCKFWFPISAKQNSSTGQELKKTCGQSKYCPPSEYLRIQERTYEWLQ
ncbi:hypothetical protein MXB_1635 [Myxobolus squamalis]|nr:hypothetical protein MXB_1635 [Myxobolus squamalis]